MDFEGIYLKNKGLCLILASAGQENLKSLYKIKLELLLKRVEGWKNYGGVWFLVLKT